MPSQEVTSFQAYDYVAFDRAGVTVMAKHIPEVEKAHVRDYPIAAQMNASGRWKFRQGGRGFDWPVQYKRGAVTGNRMVETIETTPKNRWKLAALEDRGFRADDAISELEVLQAQESKQAVVKVLDDMVGNISEDIEQVMPHVYFYDGNAPGYTEFWHGFDSFFGCNGTLKYDDGTQRAANQDDYVAYPFDNYAGLSTELGALGGSYYGTPSETNVWPMGNCDPEFEAWSPLTVIGDSNRFGGTAHTFADQGDEAIRFAIVNQGRFGRKYSSTTALMDRTLWFEFKNLCATKEEIQVQRGDKLSLVSLGFRDVINFDGIELTWDNSVPSQSVYGYSYNGIDGRSLYPKLINPFGPRYDFIKQKHEAVAKVGGNLKFKSPRNFWRVLATYAQLS